jgi:copper chaperone CopZ
MKNIIIATIILIIAGLIGFSIVTKSTEQTANKSELGGTKANYLETNQSANLRQAVLKIDGMFCVSCATGAEYALKEKVGVIDASVDYDSESGNVVYDPSKISKEEIIQAIKPYTAVITEDKPFK